MKAKYAEEGIYFQGSEANYELAANLVSNGVLTGEDLLCLTRRGSA